MLKRVRKFFSAQKKRVGRGWKNVPAFVDKRPLSTFFIVLGTILALIVLSNVLGAPKQVQKPEVVPTKTVRAYQVGTAPRLTLQAQVTKTGTIRISALTLGVVQSVKKEGDEFFRGQTLANISTNYAGGNAPALQAKLARIQYQNTLDTERLQKDLIQRQRDLAGEVNEAAKETDLSKVQKDVTNLQLDLQGKSIDVTKETQLTQLQLAQVTAGMMFPSAPFNGTVEKVFVKVGQTVSPGQDIMIVSQNVEDPITAAAYVSADIATIISTAEPSTLYIGDEIIQERPFYVSQDAVQGTLYAIYFDIPEALRKKVPEGGSVRIDLPIEEKAISSPVPFIPIDAVYQTKEKNYVYVVVNGRAQSKSVNLGEVFGSFVEIRDGLTAEDQIILDRNVVSGDKVVVQ